MVLANLFATEFTPNTDDSLIGRFKADATGVTFTRVGQTEPVSDEEFESLFGLDYQVRTDDGEFITVSSKSDPEAYVEGLPDRWGNGYTYAVIITE